MGKTTVCIVGLGYVGLPLACRCAEVGFVAKGFDLDKKKIELISSGKSPIDDKWLQAKVRRLHKKMQVSANARQALNACDVIVVCVPTPAKGSRPDLAPVRSACRAIAENIQPGQRPLIVVESTVYPGTLRHIVKPIIERNGLKAEKDFFLAHCPERIDPGNRQWTLENIPRVFAALSSEGEKRGLSFYKKIIKAKIILFRRPEEAEAVKVVENTFRDVNIAFVNELSKSFEKMGIDLSEVIKGASTKPFGFMPFYPGPGVGGHCIAQDPYYLIARAKQAGFTHRFLQLAREINNSMPLHTVSLVGRSLGRLGLRPANAKIAILGISYKPNVDDARESPALKIIGLLRKRNAKPVVFDPFFPGMSNAGSLQQAVRKADCVVLATHHSLFVKKLSPAFLKRNKVRSVVDARNVLDKQGIIEKGIIYFGIGR